MNLLTISLEVGQETFGEIQICPGPLMPALLAYIIKYVQRI